MPAISEEPERIKVVHTYGPGLHSTDLEPDFEDPRWHRRQVLEFVDFAVEAEELGFDGVTVTEHHACSMTCPSPHLLLAAAAGPRPAIAVAGTPDQIVDSLRRALEETGARRLLVETFSREEMRLFAAEVLPALHAAAGSRSGD